MAKRAARSRVGRWLIATGGSLAINGALLSLLALQRTATPPPEAPPLLIELLRAQPPPAQPSKARTQAPPLHAAAAPSPSTPSPAPAPFAAAPARPPQATPPGPSTPAPALRFGCLGRSQSEMSRSERVRCQRELGLNAARPNPLATDDETYAALPPDPEEEGRTPGLHGNGLGAVFTYPTDNKNFIPGSKHKTTVFEPQEIYNLPVPTDR